MRAFNGSAWIEGDCSANVLAALGAMSATIHASHNSIANSAVGISCAYDTTGLGSVENSWSLYFRGDLTNDPITFRYIDNSGATVNNAASTSPTGYGANTLYTMIGGIDTGAFVNIGNTQVTAAFNVAGGPPVRKLTIGDIYLFTGVLSGEKVTGDAARAGIWSAKLTAREAAAIAAGIPLNRVRPASLVFWAPLVQTLTDHSKTRQALTNNSTTVATRHCRSYYGA